MLRRCNARGRAGRVAWLFVGVGLMLAGLSAQPAAAQPGEQADAPEIGWAEGEAAFEWVQRWVRSEDGVPEDQALPERRVTGLFGVCVTLRDSGRVLGRGEAYRDNVADAIDQPGPPIQLAPLLADATRKALDELRDRQMKRAVEVKITDPDLFKQALLDKRQDVQVDIQLGHGLESVVLPLDAPDNAVFTQLAPGYHGLRLAGPINAKPSYAWPATELSRNTSPPRTVFGLLADQGYDAEDLPLIARGDGPALQRFKVIHFVRTGPARPVHQLTRGNLILSEQVIDARTIAGLAERAAQYLDRLVVTNPRARQAPARGTYQPSAQRYAPEWASPRETALLSYALTRHARVAIDQDLAAHQMQQRAAKALRLAIRLAPDALPDDEQPAPRHLTAAFVLLTLCETTEKLKPDQLVLRDRIGKTLLDLKHPEGGGYRVAPDDDQRLSRSSAAVITAALAAWHDRTRSKTLAPPVWDVLGQLIQANDDNPRPVDMFWVGLALDRAGQALAKQQADPDAAANTLADWRKTQADHLDRLSDRQVRTTPAVGPKDVLGGFIDQDTRPGTPPNPNWQSAMPVGIFALSLRNPDIVPPDRSFGPVLTAGLGARFLGQLMVASPSTFYMRDPDPALGGVRNTLWDNALAPDASAMTLLALAELQQTLHQLEP